MGDSARKSRRLSELAALAGDAKAAEAKRRKAISDRNALALALANDPTEPATYQELGEAMGLRKMAVYKALESANGGSLRNQPTEQQPTG